MVDITSKKTSLRTAIAQATVKVSMEETIEAIINKTVPKGNVLEAARVAGLFAVKRTHDMIPDCHPVPVEYTNITYELTKDSIIINIIVKAIYRTGMEVEAMHGASVVALTIYDMLKPIDKGIEINSIKLLKKTGGKSDLKSKLPKNIKAAVLYISDKVHSGKKEDTAAQNIIEKLYTSSLEMVSYSIINEEDKVITDSINRLKNEGINMIFTLGGTGLSASDITIDTINLLLDKKIDSLILSMSAYGNKRDHKSLVSRSLAGLIDKTMLICLPGSEAGAISSYEAVMPEAVYLFKSILSQ